MPKKTDTILADSLVKKGLITKKDLDPLLKESEKSGQSLQQLLLRDGLFSENKSAAEGHNLGLRP